MSSEPKRYMIHANRLCVVDDGGKFALGYVPVICADDPVLQSWKRDSEALHIMDNELRMYDHLRLERIGDRNFIEWFNDDQPEGEMPYVIRRSHGKTLREAIESASGGESATKTAGKSQEGEGK